jgi:zinc/manganese transport system ATP-binding protein
VERSPAFGRRGVDGGGIVGGGRMGLGLVEMTAPESLVSFRDVTVAYDRHPAIHHVSGSFAKGSLTAVVGPNGAGKSTLIKTIAGLLKPVEGRLSLADVTAKDIAYLPQLANIDDSFPISVQDVVLLGLWRRCGAFGRITKAMRDEASQALSTVGLDGFEERAFGSVSAGQRQRVLFARVLIADSPLILLDEPFSAVDSRTVTDLIRLVEHWHHEGRTVIAVLHDHEQVRRHFPDSLLLARELVAWGATEEVLSLANLRQARAMSEAWDVDADVCRGAA